ncbi:thiamine pyrophosphate-dependent dehydrogenase E1 component subunit alpha [Paenibacillus sp. MER TA 81-3]|uniref:thiamine pyrophosphate-dependent dehydrogenase E1 component subunit alpha n=1 Tax=Paenibacillus sp. MER TA 81-3 TaxID=2939573 RepID=UPI00203C6C34|nr:thiamine pyrophosphate-dependent dehydrogenase E1 component subunit alpha [Paenibacillus sp. MER TA 81-3]MCM3341772.1 thiamine pyrophosphate-dependent dehydrogenase E1 component subunit alpha [Paenibacillus sp. MER TA 81-3]
MTPDVTVRQKMKHEELGLTNAQAIEMYRMMVLARKYDERALLLQRAGKINFHVSGIGQEAAQVAAAFALDQNKDYFLPYYRDYGFVLSVGMTVRELMLALFGKVQDPNSGGRQMPGHFGCKRLRIVTSSSPVTTQVPHAVGIALAAKMRKEDSVSFVTLGEGSSNQGDFHEGCNFAGVHKVPAIIMVENNQYAISVPIAKQVAGRISDRALGYGFPGVRVDGCDVLEVFRVMKEARERAVRGEGPTLIEAMMYRLSPHSTSDNDLAYRTKEEVDANWEKDGIPRYKAYLMECSIWSEEDEAKLLAELKAIIDDATAYGEQASFPQPEDALTHVYAEEERGTWQ